jgi:LysW-gamma-L-lysine carboxypeptidase
VTFTDDAAIGLLTEMLRAPSLCGQEDEVAAVLLDAMAAAGFDACRDEAGNVIGTTGPVDAPSAVILGHMDTVPGVIPVEQRGGSLYGRGAVDAKGPLAAAVAASARTRTRLRVTVIGAVQEEGPSLGARHLLSRPAPDFLIIAEPSGWDSVVLGYKGSQRFTARIARPSGHTAGPEPTAPERAIEFWHRLVRWCETFGGEGEFDRLTPTLIRMGSHDDGLCDQAFLHVGLRLPPHVSVGEARAGVQTLLPEADFEFAPGEPAVRGDKTNPLVASFLRAIRAQGGKPRFKVKTGTSDMNVVGPVWNCPMVAYGPGDSRLDHTPNEHVPLDDYLRGIRVLTGVLEGLA